MILHTIHILISQIENIQIIPLESENNLELILQYPEPWQILQQCNYFNSRY